jgi:hypothetical protein
MLNVKSVPVLSLLSRVSRISGVRKLSQLYFLDAALNSIFPESLYTRSMGNEDDSNRLLNKESDN